MFMWILFFVVLALIFGMGFAFKALLITAGIFVLIPIIFIVCFVVAIFMVVLVTSLLSN